MRKSFLNRFKSWKIFLIVFAVAFIFLFLEAAFPNPINVDTSEDCTYFEKLFTQEPCIYYEDLTPRHAPILNQVGFAVFFGLIYSFPIALGLILLRFLVLWIVIIVKKKKQKNN